jgi:flavin reductase
VCVVTVVADEHKLGLTIGSFASLSLQPPLVGFAVSKEAAMHELLREAGGCAISILAAGQEWLAQHFARGVPPIAMWAGVEVEPGEGPPLLAGAVGWLRCRVAGETGAGTHTLFMGAVESAVPGAAGPPLVRLEGEYRSA